MASSRRLCRERFCGAPLLLPLFLLLLVLPLSIARVGLPTGRREEAVEKSPRNGRARRRPGLSAVHAAPQIRTDRFPVVSLSPTYRTGLPTAPSSLVRSTRAPGSALVAELLTVASTGDASSVIFIFIVRFIRLVTKPFFLPKGFLMTHMEGKAKLLFAKNEKKILPRRVC